MNPRTVNSLISMKESGCFDGLQAVCDLGAIELTLKGKTEVVRRFLEAFESPAVHDEAQIERWSKQGGYAAELWSACGLEYVAIDLSTEIPTLNLDLNFDPVPEEHRGRYGLVLNFGTTEHICNQLNAMKVIHDLCAPGGYIYHVVPFSSYQNHGFFRYNPKFFWSLCRSNDYGYLDLSIDLEPQPEPLHPDIVTNLQMFQHDPAEFEHFSVLRGCLRVLLQKRHAAHFKPPFDGIDGKAANQIPERYNEIFRPELEHVSRGPNEACAVSEL